MSGYKKRHDFELTKEEFKKLISGNCFYCGKKPSQEYNGHYKKTKGGYI